VVFARNTRTKRGSGFSSFVAARGREPGLLSDRALLEEAVEDLPTVVEKQIETVRKANQALERLDHLIRIRNVAGNDKKRTGDTLTVGDLVLWQEPQAAKSHVQVRTRGIPFVVVRLSRIPEIVFIQEWDEGKGAVGQERKVNIVNLKRYLRPAEDPLGQAPLTRTALLVDQLVKQVREAGGKCSLGHALRKLYRTTPEARQFFAARGGFASWFRRMEPSLIGNETLRLKVGTLGGASELELQ